MSKNLQQVYTANPITVIGDTDLMYVVQSGTTDAGIAGSSLKSQFISSANASTGVILRSNGTNFVATTATYPTTTTANQLLYSSTSNVIAGLATANSAVLVTSAGGVPSWLANSGTAGWVLTANSGAPPSWQAIPGGSSPWTAGAGANSAYGGGATSANGDNSLAWGVTSTSAGTSAIALGNIATASAPGSVALGDNTIASGNYSYALGSGSSATKQGSMAFGLGAASTANYAIALGNNATAAGSGSVAIGTSANPTHVNSVLICDGQNRTTDSSANQFVAAFSGGHYFYTGNILSFLLDPNLSLAIGNGSSAGGSIYAFAFGNNAVTNNDYSFAMGTGARAGGGVGGGYGFAFGNSTNANGLHCLAIGNQAITTNAGSWVIGDGNSTPQTDTAANQFAASFAGGFKLYTGDLSVATVGKGLQVKEGSNAKQGVVTLSSGVGVVSNTSVTANSRIFYCAQDTGTVGFLTITARSAGSGFTITSSVLTDSGVVAYEIFEPS